MVDFGEQSERIKKKKKSKIYLFKISENTKNAY